MLVPPVVQVGQVTLCSEWVSLMSLPSCPLNVLQVVEVREREEEEEAGEKKSTRSPGEDGISCRVGPVFCSVSYC